MQKEKYFLAINFFVIFLISFLIGGCTELALMLKAAGVECLDPMNMLIDELVQRFR